MIEIKEVDKNLSIYKNNKIIIWGGHAHQSIVDMFRVFNIEVFGFCSDNSNLYGTIINNIPVLSIDELVDLLKKENHILIQIAFGINESYIVPLLKKIGVKKYISSKNLHTNFNYLRNYNNFDFTTFTGTLESNPIKLTKIDHKLSIYKNNKVVIFGNLDNQDILQLMKYHNINIFRFCSFNNQDNINIITPENLKKLIKEDSSIIVQIGVPEQEDIIKKLEDLNISNYIDYNEAWQILKYLKRCNESYENPKKLSLPLENINENILKIHELSQYISISVATQKIPIILCMPMKTGDFTLNATLTKHKIPFYNTWHNVNLIDKNILNMLQCEHIKIITAIREPMAQDISWVYQNLANACRNPDFFNIYRMLYPFEKEAILENGGDIQYIYNRRMENLNNNIICTNVEHYINDICEKSIDIKKVPFDKEKGYSIIKEGNLEIFIYQIEKLNNIIPELAEFVGGNFTELENSNQTSDKWIADSYKIALKELKINQQYFYKCFSEPYVSHFYSEKDIKKFKERWQPHIK